jgi:16S rRNA (guanine1516-N2)-methyltransferase
MGERFSEQFTFQPGQATELLSNWPKDKPDAIYLDPMFPHKKKSALVKKEMRLFQHLLGPDDDADRLLEPAIQLAQKRVVVKRPDYAPFLADKKPSMQIKSKKHRFDVYLM